MRVLLTRAADDAVRTRATLESLGHRVLVSPVIAIEATAADWPGGVVDAVLATSGQAFVAIKAGWGPTREARRLMPMWLVGSRTEAAARASGFVGAAFTAANAVSLAFEMGKRSGGGRVVYLAGRDRKPDIETALSVTEQAVEVVELYEARAASRLDEPAVSSLSVGAIDVVLHFSRRSATIFADLLRGGGLPEPACNICLSHDVAAPLVELGWTVRVADQPNEASMIDAVARR